DLGFRQQAALAGRVDGQLAQDTRSQALAFAGEVTRDDAFALIARHQGIELGDDLLDARPGIVRISRHYGFRRLASLLRTGDEGEGGRAGGRHHGLTEETGAGPRAGPPA